MRYGQAELIADLLPVSVDGMMVVATVALGDGRPHRWSAWVAFWTGVAASVIANVLAAEPSGIARCISAWPAVAFLLVVEVITRGGRVRMDRNDARTEAGSPQPGEVASTAPRPQRLTEPTDFEELKRPARFASRKLAKTTRRPLAQTRKLAADLRAKYPTITQAELARQLGISATRLRQVERTEDTAEGARPVNDADLPQPSEVSV